MAKARCVLCGTELVGKTCPKCSIGAAGDPLPIDRDTDKRPAARRRAPAPAPVRVAEDPEGPTDKVAPLEPPGPRRSRPTAPARPVARPEREPEPDAEPEAEPEQEAEEPEQQEKPRSKTEEKKNWYALAGMERPPDMPSAHGQEEALPEVSTKEDELRGYHPAAVILAATGLSCFAIGATGAMPEVGAGVFNLIAAGALFKHYSWAKFLAIAFALLHIGKMALGLVLTGSSAFVIGMLPQACVIGAFVFDEARWRAVAAGVGVALAFSWVGFYAFRPPPARKASPLEEFTIEGGKWSDDKFGLSVSAPKGIALIDAAKAKDKLKDEKGGLIGLFVKQAVKQRPTNDRLLVKGTEIDLDGSIKMATLPPMIRSTSVLAPIFGEESKPQRDDDLVPKAIRETEGLATEGWRDYWHRVVLIRAADGRMVTAICNPAAAGAEHLCAGFFAGLSLKPSLK